MRCCPNSNVHRIDKSAQVNARDGDRYERLNERDGLAADRRKDGAEGFVAPDHFVQSTLEDIQVERSVNSDRNRNVICVAALLELIEEPESLLREGEWGLFGPGCALL